MSEANSLPLAQPATPLDYSQQYTGEMVWIVRFCAAYMLIVRSFVPLLYTSILLAELFGKSSPDQIPFGMLVPSFGWMCAIGMVAVAIWHLRREAFWAAIVLILLPGSLLTSMPGWEQILSELPKDSAIAVLVWLLYRRARDNGILRPFSGRDLHSTPARDDLLFFLGLVGAWQVAGLLGFAASYVTHLLGFAPDSSPTLVQVATGTCCLLAWACGCSSAGHRLCSFIWRQRTGWCLSQTPSTECGPSRRTHALPTWRCQVPSICHRRCMRLPPWHSSSCSF